MTWIMVVAAALLVFAALVFVFRLPRGGWELAGAALFAGLAGYAFQASPDLGGSPTAPRESGAGTEAAMIEARRAMGDEFGAGRNYLITADAMARNGQFASAATLLKGAIRKTPEDPDLWLALGNALVGHAEGVATPAALYAYRRSALIAPDHPGPDFFAGLALAGSGRYREARARWQTLLDRPRAEDETDADAWRMQLAQQVERLDRIIAMQDAAGQGGGMAVDPAGEAAP